MKIKDLLNEDSAAWARAFQHIDSGQGPSTDYEWAVKFKLAGIEPERIINHNNSEKYRRLGYKGDPTNVNRLLAMAPSITDLEKMISDRETSTSQQAQANVVADLQHQLTVQQLIAKNELDKAEIQSILQMDSEARQAIRERMQNMELDAKERLAKIEIDIRKSKEGERQDKENEKQREFELEKARANHSREVEVIRLTAEGEYQKAKLEADYQLHIKQLTNIDNAQERQNRLDSINAEKQKELATIDARTNSRIKELSAETDAKWAESDIRIHEAFMMKFKDVWGNMITKASETGKTLGQNISAVMGALGRLSKPIMPKSQQPVESIAYFRDLISEMEKPTLPVTPPPPAFNKPVPAKDIKLPKEEWNAKFKDDPEVKIINPLTIMPKDGSWFSVATKDGQAVGVSTGSSLSKDGNGGLGPATHVVFAAPKSVDQVLKDFNVDKLVGSNKPSRGAESGPGKIDPDTKCKTCGTPYKNHFRFDSNGKIVSTTVRHMTMKNDFPGMAGMDPVGSRPSANRVLRQPMALKK